jgi:xylulokinase
VDANAVRAMSVSGQQHGLVCMDREGNLTRKASKLWNDVSTHQECIEITGAMGGREDPKF